MSKRNRKNKGKSNSDPNSTLLYIVSTPEGDTGTLEAMMSLIEDPTNPVMPKAENDYVILLGNTLGTTEKTKGMIEYLMELKKEYKEKLVLLLGESEHKLLSGSLDSWKGSSGIVKAYRVGNSYYKERAHYSSDARKLTGIDVPTLIKNVAFVRDAFNTHYFSKGTFVCSSGVPVGFSVDKGFKETYTYKEESGVFEGKATIHGNRDIAKPTLRKSKIVLPRHSSTAWCCVVDKKTGESKGVMYIDGKQNKPAVLGM